MMDSANLFKNAKVSTILLKMAPPVMLAQLIQALYNIIDSLFVARYSGSGLTALSIIYPVQLLMIALAVGTGVGINTIMAAKLGVGKKEESMEYAGMGAPLAIVLWLLFAVVGFAAMPAYARASTSDLVIIADVIRYGRIVCVFSFGLFLESAWRKVLQAEGDMKTPMLAQIIGALTNIILDPLLIFGLFGLPEMGIGGAAAATVAGQVAAALVVMKRGFRKSPGREKYRRYAKHIFRRGAPNILMQSTYTFYILGLNLILAGFSDQAVTTLGLYYKWQTFFYIPLGAMQTCIVPVVSFNYAANDTERCKEILWTAVKFGVALMTVGMLCFVLVPVQMLRVFTSDNMVIEIGRIGFRIVGISFLPMVISQTFPVFFQAVGAGLKSSFLTVIRTVVLFVPLGFLFSRFGLNWFWLTFPVTEVLTALTGLRFYRQFLQHPYVQQEKQPPKKRAVIHPSRPGMIITIAREHGSSGKQIGKLVAQKLDIPFYYKEMTALAAQESGMDKEFVSGINQNAPEYLHELYLSTKVVQRAMIAQHKVIQKIAENGSCVIVGRAADYVLKNHPDLIRVFIYAPKKYRVKTVMEVYGDSYQEAQKNIHRSDRARSAYYHNISGRKWGDRKNYDLLLDASIDVEETADLIVSYAMCHEHAVSE